MKVIPTTAAVTRYNGDAISLVRGREHDLPDDLAERLITAGLVAAVDPEPEPTEEERLAAEKAEQERLDAEKAEAEKAAAEKAEQEKAEAAKKAAAQKKGSPSGKKLDGAPENK